MLTKHCLQSAHHQLELAGIETARLDALILLEYVMGLDRARILAEPEQELTKAQEAKLKKLLNRRVEHEPLAYVRRKTEFYGREFVITPAVLEPRPESETMIDLLRELATTGMLDIFKSKNDGIEAKTMYLADVGTGSGALGITAKLELSGTFQVAVDLLDIDPNAMKVAKINVDKYTTDVVVLMSDLLTQTKQYYDILLCNLPYVPDDYEINKAARHEPSIALFGGPDGLDLYRKLFKHIATLPKRPLYILSESLPAQHSRLNLIAEAVGYELVKSDDFIQVFRSR